METKKCNRCEQEKTLSNYHKCKEAKDGLRSACKACTKLYNQEKYKTSTKKKRPQKPKKKQVQVSPEEAYLVRMLELASFMSDNVF